MNNCFISGKIITEIDFKFAIKNKFYSIAEFKIELDNKSIIKIKAYDKNAEYCYQKLEKEMYINIYGKIDNKGDIKLLEIN
mgnify:FL=1